MSSQETRLDRFANRYAVFIDRWRWLVLVAAVVAAAGMASGAQFLKPLNDYKMWFDGDNPELLAFDAVHDTYTKNENILFVLTPGDGKVFTTDTLRAVRELTEAAWRLPYAIRVDSVSNFQHMHAEGDELIVEDLVADPAAADLARREGIALDEPNLVNRLINPEGTVTGVNVTFQMPLESQDEIPEAVNAARDLAADISAAHPGVELRLTGSVMLNQAFAEAAYADMGTLVPLVYLLILVVMWLLLRSVMATLTGFVLIVFSILAGLGMGGWLGIPLTPPMGSAPTVIMTLAVADAVHLFVSFFHGLRDGKDRREALAYALRLNLKPVFLTSISTAVGFLTMNFSDSPPFRDFGNVVAIGIMAAWLFAMTLLPVLMVMLPWRAPKARTGMDMARMGSWVVARRKPIVAVTLVVSVGLLALIPRNELNDEFVKYFSDDMTFRQHTDYAMEHLTGVNQVQFSLPSGDYGHVSRPEYLAALGEFTAWLRAQPGVIHVDSLADTFKRLNQAMHGDDPEWHRLPEQRDLSAQYLLLYSMSLPNGLDLNNRLSIDESMSQVVVTLDTVSSKHLREFAVAAERWLDANAPFMATSGTGTPVMFAHISERNIKGMLGGTLIGLAVISLLLLLAFRSLKLGLISLFANVLPAGLAFGLWGLFVGQVNLAVSVVATMMLGIVVDDTIHFLSKYQFARRSLGHTAAEAVAFSFSRVGMALVVTTVILTMGFLVLAMSTFKVNASMAQLTAVGIVIALALDLLLLPALLTFFDGEKTLLNAETPAPDASRAVASVAT